MRKFDDSLRGYGLKIYQRDNFKCRYCGTDGRKSFDTWLTLSCDHLLPKGHPDRDNPDYIVTACNFCNTADNHYFEHAKKRGLNFDELSPDELVAQRLPYVQAVRQEYRNFWEKEVNTLER
jgi:5-methylcytosine-specific restriction endonuclease McrA